MSPGARLLGHPPGLPWGLGLLCLLCGCDPGYYLHLARGQARVFLGCQDVDEVVARPETEAAVRQQLELVQEICLFAVEEVGLDASDSYRCLYDTGGRPVSWNVSASPPDRFEPYLWRFPLVGAVPYKGFFDEERARREARRLAALGYDVLVQPVAAYSTLGYLADPVLSTMLDETPEALADLILHELTHGTVYVRGQTDFSESLASYIGAAGSLQFLCRRYGTDSPEVMRAVQQRQDAALFGQLVGRVTASLDSLYGSGLPREQVLRQRHEVFDRAKDSFRQVRPRFQVARHDAFLAWEVNNARLLSYRRYHRDLGAFEALQARCGSLAGLVAACRRCASEADPWTCISRSAAASA